MFGLAYLLFFAVYLLLSLAVVVLAGSWAGRRKRSRLLWGGVAVLLMYNLVFWDWLPTVYVHKYYCEKEAGFWVYKTHDQWKAENPGVMEGLVSYNKTPGGFTVNWPFQYKQEDDGHSKTLINHINERFDELFIQKDVSDILPIIRKENVLWDKKRGETIAHYVDFGTGNSVKNTVGPPGPLKFWLHNRSCIGGNERQTRFGNFYIQFKGAEK